MVIYFAIIAKGCFIKYHYDFCLVNVQVNCEIIQGTCFSFLAVQLLVKISVWNGKLFLNYIICFGYKCNYSGTNLLHSCIHLNQIKQSFISSYNIHFRPKSTEILLSFGANMVKENLNKEVSITRMLYPWNLITLQELNYKFI